MCPEEEKEEEAIYASPKGVTYTEGLVDTQHPAVLDAHLVVSAQSQLSTCEDARP